MLKKETFIASLLGGAIGDALGYRVEFMKLHEIKSRFGDEGINDLVLDDYAGKALISDDTQMTLFTADGMIWAYERMRERGIGSYAGSGVYQSYLRWLYTQTKSLPDEHYDWLLDPQPHEESGSILAYKELFSLRAPGNTCLSALESNKMGTMGRPINDSKGCGGVMRVAPVGLFLYKDPAQAFKVAADIAAITHGHPSGYLASGALAVIIAELLNGKSIAESAHSAMAVLKEYPQHEETLSAMENATELAGSDESPVKAITKLGEGWVAEEALGVSLYCAMKESDFKKALILAVNHDGDSDSTGAICGNILGASYGIEAIPEDWAEQVELKELIADVASRLYDRSIKM
ncbi:ADP-ribosylglycohydrolase family protein [Mesobacillus selenatarsenatis]|uniref:ADP-ribosylglycohydrolase family protein n=1 Tax=Mesobacillus selenatarsenatis TaxID=388741 RepID=A0A846TS88_9BACI|nr:ADP-ribosylglycohydrolase family protein [Mesobacillus selenatarsenatis]NKE07075.1 ADP-ribosylglycohydrolase family protein [Mesobacillus selenatarsenatis]